MGIRCLTKFINSYGERYYTPYKLSPGYVVIDGGIYLDIYDYVTDDDPRFGGDCKKMYDATYSTFKRFLDSGVTPIVVLGGQSSEMKKKTMRSRDDQCLNDIIKYNGNGYRFETVGITNIMFRVNAFFEALGDLGVFSCRCEFEADGEMAELAKKLNCPVIGLNSDFYVYEGVTFLHWKKIRFADSVDCWMFDRERFCSDFGVSSSVLPLLGVFFESYYCKRDAFDALFPKDYSSWTKKFQTALRWLKNRSVQSAREEISKAVVKRDGNGVREDLNQEIDYILNEYRNTGLTILNAIRERFDFGDVDFNVKNATVNLPPEIMRRDRLSSTFLGMYTQHQYKTRPMLEKETEKSIHFPSIPLIQGIYGLIMRDDEQTPALQLEIRDGDKMVTLSLNGTSFPSTDPVDNLLQILKVDVETYVNVKELFDEDWLIFVSSLIYFKRECANVTDVHIHSIMLTAFVLHACSSGSFSTRFKVLSKDECRRVADKVSALDIKKSSNVPLFDITNIHYYLSFQACFFYVKQIFTLLGLPDELRVTGFISGSIFYSLSKALEESESSELYWIRGWFGDENEEVFGLYSLVVDKLRDNGLLS